MERPRVLVVEDKPSVLKLIATVLENAYQVHTAPDGAAAISMIGSMPFDAVLTDIRMEGMTGFDVLRAAQQRAPQVEVVMMTAYANVTDAVAAIKLGAYDYVAKPLDADEIALVVARAVEHRREREERPPEPAPEARANGHQEDGPAVSAGFRQAVEEARDRASRGYLARLMHLCHGNVTRAALRAGMTRESLHRVLRKYGVSPEGYRETTGNGAPANGAPANGAPGNGAPAPESPPDPGSAVAEPGQS
jgi:DNA-binding NtrC family response regulator